MLVDIKPGDNIPAGLYILADSFKFERVAKRLPQSATGRDILIEYDKIGGLVFRGDDKLPPQTLWKLEEKKKAESLDNATDEELFAIIRKAENTNIPGSRYQRAKKEWQIRKDQRLIEAANKNQGGVSIGPGATVVNKGILQGSGTATQHISKQVLPEKTRWIIATLIVGILAIPGVLSFVIHLLQSISQWLIARVLPS